MSEQKLKDAFDHMGPDETARQRMLANILAAHEAGSALEQQSEQPGLQLVEQPAAQPLQAETPALVELKKPRRRPKEFSFLRYFLPIAACLLFAAVAPPLIPQMAYIYEDFTSPPSSSVQSNGSSVTSSQQSQQPEPQQPDNQEPADTAPGDATPGDSPQSEIPLDATDDPAVVDAAEPSTVVEPSVAPSESPVLSDSTPSYAPPPASSVVQAPTPYMAKPEPWPTPLDIIALTLSSLALLAAIIITIRAIISWRRKKQK